MIEKTFWRLVQICWYAAIAFLYCLALVLTDKDAYVPAYVCMVVTILMSWISIKANEPRRRKQ